MTCLVITTMLQYLKTVQISRRLSSVTPFPIHLTDGPRLLSVTGIVDAICLHFLTSENVMTICRLRVSPMIFLPPLAKALHSVVDFMHLITQNVNEKLAHMTTYGDLSVKN